MDSERLEKLEKIFNELQGRAIMHELLFAQLLGSVGSASGNIGRYVSGVLKNVESDLREGVTTAPDEKTAIQFAIALKTLENFSENMQGAIGQRRGSGLN